MYNQFCQNQECVVENNLSYNLILEYVISDKMKFVLSAGSEGSRIGSCKLREARSLISSVVNPGYSKIAIKEKENTLH